MSVTCSIVKGDLPIQIDWQFDNKTINENNNDDYVVASTNKKNSVLSIDSVAAKHVGHYTCLARNQAGLATHTAFLAVNGILL